MKAEAGDQGGMTLLELEQLIAALTGECSSIRRRQLAQSLVQGARRLVATTVARTETLDKIHRLIDELECLPTSMQRYDHQAHKLAWALRKLQAQRPTLLREARADERAAAVDFYGELGAAMQDGEASPYIERRV
jgi:hypothetical protein